MDIKMFEEDPDYIAEVFRRALKRNGFDSDYLSFNAERIPLSNETYRLKARGTLPDKRTKVNLNLELVVVPLANTTFDLSIRGTVGDKPIDKKDSFTRYEVDNS
jgi:hypothetical protein